MFLKFSILFLIFNLSSSLKLRRRLNHIDLYTQHGLVIGYFTFSGKGIAGMNYTVKPFRNITDLKLSVFPTAFDPFMNLKRIRKFYSQTVCKEFFHKAIYSVRLDVRSQRVALGRFSGGFAVAVVLSNRFSCLPLLKRLHTEEILDENLDIEVLLYNPDEDGNFVNHLSSVDQDMLNILYILLGLYVLMALWTIYSIRVAHKNDVVLMRSIQKVIATIVALQIVVYTLLIVVYRCLSAEGLHRPWLEVAADQAAQVVRYLELHIIVAWTLSSPSSGLVSRLMLGCWLVHTLAALVHHSKELATPAGDTSCVSVWECEPHQFSPGGGLGAPAHYSRTQAGWLCFLAGWLLLALGSLFVLHLVKLGLGLAVPVTTGIEHHSDGSIVNGGGSNGASTNTGARRAYVSVFCSAAIFWTWSYPAAWLFSSLLADYYQYKFIMVAVSLCHIAALPAVLRVTRISPEELDQVVSMAPSPATSVVIYD